MLVLGLDPSLRAYGWALYDSSAENPRVRRRASGHEGTVKSTVPVARFMHFRALVESLIRKYKPQAVGIESPAYDGGPFAETHFGLMMFSLEAVFEHRLDCVMFDPTTLKYLTKQDPASRKGQITKIDMQQFVSLDTEDPRLIDNNEADAYCVGKFSCRMISLANGDLDPNDLTIAERRVFLERTRKVSKASGTKIVRKVAHIFRENSRFYRFSRVPKGSVSLPDKSMINPSLLTYLEGLHAAEEVLNS